MCHRNGILFYAFGLVKGKCIDLIGMEMALAWCLYQQRLSKWASFAVGLYQICLLRSLPIKINTTYLLKADLVRTILSNGLLPAVQMLSISIRDIRLGIQASGDSGFCERGGGG